MTCKTSQSDSPASPCATALRLSQERTTNRRLLELLEQARGALATCKEHYSEYNQFEGSWDKTYDDTKVSEALQALHAELGLPPPAPSRQS